MKLLELIGIVNIHVLFGIMMYQLMNRHVYCGQCATVCPCNAMMEVNMEGNAGYMTDTEPGSLAAMIDLTKKAEPGYGPLFAISDSEAEMRKERIKKTKTVCTYCGVGCSF